MSEQKRIGISSDADIVDARQEGRALAARLGFSSGDQVLVATAVSELARNILEYASQGEMIIAKGERDGVSGVIIVARDQGPGISDIPQALQDGYSSGQGLGLGLPGTRRLMDEFEICSTVGQGTTVTVKKWKPPSRS